MVFFNLRELKTEEWWVNSYQIHVFVSQQLDDLSSVSSVGETKIDPLEHLRSETFIVLDQSLVMHECRLHVCFQNIAQHLEPSISAFNVSFELSVTNKEVFVKLENRYQHVQEIIFGQIDFWIFCPCVKVFYKGLHSKYLELVRYHDPSAFIENQRTQKYEELVGMVLAFLAQNLNILNQVADLLVAPLT